MSFVVAAALAVGLLIAIPIAAHLLRRGRMQEQEFPPAALVPARQVVARQRSRLEDRLLLGLRALIVLALALLGATPLVQCSRLSLDRSSGASVALAIVLDDSLSMRATLKGGQSRWQSAKGGALELLRSAREGDAVAIVLAGKPARLALSATTDLGAARAALDELVPSDRATELGAAVSIARSTLKALPHADKRIAVLSDFADASAGKLEGIWVPLPELAEAVDDCGVASAEVRGRRVSATVACTSAAAAAERTLEVVAAAGGSASPGAPDAEKPATTSGDGVIATSKVPLRPGLQTIAVELPTALTNLDVRLTGKDALEADDQAPVAPETSALLVGVLTDPTSGTVSTGGATVLEQALSSLGSEAIIRPLSLVPDDRKELTGITLLVLDDPPGFGPEARTALTAWLDRGGVALALLGPRSASAQLGSTLAPFVPGGVRWEPNKAPGVAPGAGGALATLLSDGSGLERLEARARIRFDPQALEGSSVLARWTDREPLLLERAVGRGVALSAGLPSSVEYSDFALRPGFLALLDHALGEARRHTGLRRTPAGVPWAFAGHGRIEIVGPSARSDDSDRTELRASDARDPSFVPAIHGRYQLQLDGEPQVRVVTLEADEIAARPAPPADARNTRMAGAAPEHVDASPELSLVLLAIVFAELVFRALTRWRATRRPAPAA